MDSARGFFLAAEGFASDLRFVAFAGFSSSSSIASDAVCGSAACAASSVVSSSSCSPSAKSYAVYTYTYYCLCRCGLHRISIFFRVQCSIFQPKLLLNLRTNLPWRDLAT